MPVDSGGVENGCAETRGGRVGAVAESGDDDVGDIADPVRLCGRDIDRPIHADVGRTRLADPGLPSRVSETTAGWAGSVKARAQTVVP